MSLINDLMQRVASLTNRLNEIGANSKRTEEMPLMNPVDRNSLLRVSKGGVSYKIPVQGIVDELSLPNEVIQIGLLEVVPDGSGESLKIPDTPTPIWRINGQEFLKNTETLVPIPYAANDKYRTDLVVADTNSDFYRVEGTEGDFLGLAPNIPANTVEVTRINIFGNQIGNPSPTPTNGFVTKSSKQYRSVNLNSTSPTKLYLSHESTTFDIQNSVLNGSIGGFYGFSSDNDGYDGLDIYIKNSNANPITIVHNESTSSTPFNLPSGIDIVLQGNHIAHFKLNKADEVVELVGVATGGGILPYEFIIDEMLTDQANQSEQNIIFVEKAHEDPSLVFPQGEARTYAYYQLRSDSTKTGSLSDYRLISAPWANVSTGLEAIDEGNGIGWRLKGRNPDNYGNIGNEAIDLGASYFPSTTVGATGEQSTVGGGANNKASGSRSTVGGGMNNTASGSRSTVGGGAQNTASANQSTVGGGDQNIASGAESTVGGGRVNTASGNFSTVSGGRYNIAKTFGEFLGGLWSTIKEGNATAWIGTDRIFGVGNGKSSSERSDAFNVYKNGVAELPSVTNSLIDAAGAKTIPTKEWVENNKQLTTLETIEDLESYNGDATTAIVKDTLRGGVFNYEPTGLTVDEGVIFEATGKGSGYWQRQYNQADGLNILWYGADPTGTADNADIIEDVIKNQSIKTGLIVFPTGEYAVERMIGDVAPVGSGTITISNDIKIIGYGASIKMRSATEVSAIFGMEVENANIHIEGLTFDGDSIANRGIYFRQISYEDASNVIIEKTIIKNIFIGDESAISAGNAIAVFGKFDSATITESYMHDIHSGNSSSIRGIFINGNDIGDRNVKKIYINNNRFKNIFRVDDETTNEDQDAIYIGSGDARTSAEDNSATISNNYFVNCRGRSVKIQRQKTIVKGNVIVFEPDFIGAHMSNNSYINVQYGDTQILNNSFIFRNTNEIINRSIIAITADASDPTNSRNIIKGNFVYADFPIDTFIFVYERDSGSLFKGNVVISDNTINTDVTDFSYFYSSSTETENRSFKFQNNSVNSIDGLFFNNDFEKNVNLQLIGNLNYGTDVEVSNLHQDLAMIDNVGFLEENSYVLRKQIKTIPDASYTLLETDKNKILQFTSTTDVTITIPTGLSVGNRYEGKQRGTGQLIFVDDGTTVINIGASETNKTLEQFSVFGLDCVATDEYDLFGKLELI